MRLRSGARLTTILSNIWSYGPGGILISKAAIVWIKAGLDVVEGVRLMKKIPRRWPELIRAVYEEGYTLARLPLTSYNYLTQSELALH